MGHAEAARETPVVAAERALVSRGSDLWFLGGASLVVWFGLVCIEQLRPHSWAVRHHLEALAAVSGTLALVGNYPHFMASYLLAYRRGGPFIRRFWFQLVAVPVLLVALLALGGWLYRNPEAGRGFFDAVHRMLTAAGLRTQIGTAPTAGKELLGLMVGFMYFTVGWHYSKQTYGCMMVYASFEKYPLSARQRTVLRWALFSVWWTSFIYLHGASDPSNYSGLTYYSLGLPPITYYLALAVSVAMFLAVVHLVLVKNHRDHGRRPSPTFLVPYLAFAVWWLPPLFQREFFFFVVPFFHSLQYLAFVQKVERERLRESRPADARMRGSLIALGLFVVGFLAFELVPDTVDVATGSHTTLGLGYFLAAVPLFINIHHYFIDNVIWRFDQRETREYLLA